MKQLIYLGMRKLTPLFAPSAVGKASLRRIGGKPKELRPFHNYLINSDPRSTMPHDLFHRRLVHAFCLTRFDPAFRKLNNLNSRAPMGIGHHDASIGPLENGRIAEL